MARKKASRKGYLDGQLLIAMPGMEDSRFVRSVILVCAHSAEGAMGIAINQPVPQFNFRDLLVQLDIIEEDISAIRMPPTARDVLVQRGGPVETERGFVLHSADYFIESATLPIDEQICLTRTVDILKAIAKGDGPEQAMVALGYAGWGPGQLESEIQANGWLHGPATPELIFDRVLETKYQRAMALIGIHPAMLSAEAGHA